MNAAELKIDLFRKLDSLKGNRLEEAYGVLLNYINSKNDINDWDDLTREQQAAIYEGIEQLDKGEGRKHNVVISDFRNKFTND